MIRIYKDNDIKLVTKGAYENTYAPLGYKVIIEAKAQEVTKEPTKTEEVKVEEPVRVEEPTINEDATKTTTKSKESSKIKRTKGDKNALSN